MTDDKKDRIEALRIEYELLKQELETMDIPSARRKEISDGLDFKLWQAHWPEMLEVVQFGSDVFGQVCQVDYAENRISFNLHKSRRETER